jgi:hypothetical protein
MRGIKLPMLALPDDCCNDIEWLDDHVTRASSFTKRIAIAEVTQQRPRHRSNDKMAGRARQHPKRTQPKQRTR